MAAEELLALYTLTTHTRPGSLEEYFVLIATALYVNSTMTPELRKRWGVTSDSPLRSPFSGKG